ncbi:MAG: hypothetical protein AAB457_00140 [Patescibacteria group bacterium]
MPGNKLYQMSRIFDEAKKYWYWGNLSSYRYYLGQSDKALVEAKTLFEYNQYLLAVKALDRSNAALQHVPDTLKRAKDEGKNIEKYEREFGEAMKEHKKIIGKLLGELPEEFIWRPEREKSQTLRIHEELNSALRLRQ